MSSSVKSCQVVSNQQKVVSSSHVKEKKYCQVMTSDANHAETPCPRVASAYTPPIDESRSGPARSAVKQAKTHFEQEAELAIMHAKKTYSSPRRAEPTCIAKEVIMHRKGTKGRTFDTIATIHPQQPPEEAYSSPIRIPKLPPTLGKGGGRRSPWISLGKERKPSAKGVTPSVKGVTIRKWAYHLGKRGQLQQKKGQSSEQKGPEARRELTELCRESTGLGKQKSQNHLQK